MRISCPHCGADEGRCPEALPACRARGDETRRLYARANGSEVETLRAENEALRAELDRIARERLVVALPRMDRPRPALGDARAALLSIRLGPVERPGSLTPIVAAEPLLTPSPPPR